MCLIMPYCYPFKCPIFSSIWHSSDFFIFSVIWRELYLKAGTLHTHTHTHTHARNTHTHMRMHTHTYTHSIILIKHIILINNQFHHFFTWRMNRYFSLAIAKVDLFMEIIIFMYMIKESMQFLYSLQYFPSTYWCPYYYQSFPMLQMCLRFWPDTFT
jgi:hypothetical protein